MDRKTLCEDIGQQDTCMGRDDLLGGFTFDVPAFEGEETEDDLVDSLCLTLPGYPHPDRCVSFGS